IGSSEAREQSERLRLVRERRRARMAAMLTSAAALVLAGLGGWALYLKSRADDETNKAQIALARSAVQDGTKLLEDKDDAEPGQALGYFARALRTAPHSVAAVSWVSDLLLRSTWWMPVAGAQHQGAVYSAAF